MENNVRKMKRSSLKVSSPLNVNEIRALQTKSKRNSVSWNIGNPFNFKELKTTFENETNENKSHHNEKFQNRKSFEEARKKSIKDEFALAKEVLKNKKLMDEIELEEEEVKKNTEKNKEVGKQNDDDSNSVSENSEEEKK